MEESVHEDLACRMTVMRRMVRNWGGGVRGKEGVWRKLLELPKVLVAAHEQGTVTNCWGTKNGVSKLDGTDEFAFFAAGIDDLPETLLVEIVQVLASGYR